MPPSRSRSTNIATGSTTENEDEKNEIMEEISVVSLASSASFMILINYFIQVAYRIRLLAIVDFGTVIHEFDPYFNFRATEVSISLKNTYSF